MKILTRQVIVSKTIQEANQILRSCAYYFPKAIFKESAFSMHCAKRHNGGYLSLTHIRGTVIECEDRTIVTLEIHANLYFFLGCLIILLGIITLIYCFVSSTNRWIPCLGMILLGLFVCGQRLWEGSELLDLIEHKLKRL